MAVQGYLWRMHDGFFSDPEFYNPMPDLTSLDISLFRLRLANMFLPSHLWHKEPHTAQEVPHGYHLYKGKCLFREGISDLSDDNNGQNENGLTCEKPHAHEREIISNASDPLKPALSICARALRLAKFHADDFCWTVWNQLEIKKEVEVRFSRLAKIAAFSRVCKCGKKKSSSLTCIRVDAPHFFKAADVQRGCRRGKILIDRIRS
jgi:hypothetical protein